MKNYRTLGIFAAVALYITATGIQVFIPDSFSIQTNQLAAVATATQPITTVYDEPGTYPPSLTFDYPSETEVTVTWYMPNGCIPWSIDWGDNYKNVYNPPAECGTRAYTHVRTHTYTSTSTHEVIWSIASTTGKSNLDRARSISSPAQCPQRLQICPNGQVSFMEPTTCSLSQCMDSNIRTPITEPTTTLPLPESEATTTSPMASTTPTTEVTATTTPQNCSLARTLGRGSRGEDVTSLQKFLLASGMLSADAVSGFYGPLTEVGVQKFQTTKGIVTSGTAASTGYGAVGPRTRAQISLCNSTEGLSASVASSTATSTATTTPSNEFLGVFIPQIPTNISISACPIYPLPMCSAGTHLERGTVSIGCLGPSVCVADEKNTPTVSNTTTNTQTTPSVQTSTISSEVPVVSSSFAAFPRKGAVPLTVNFLSTTEGSYSVTYGDGTPVEYFTGLNAGISRQFTHTYNRAGAFLAKVQKSSPAASCVSATSCPTLTTTVASLVITVNEPELTTPQI